MAFRYSVTLRNAALDARIAAVGPSPILKIYASAQQAGKRPGGELVSMQLDDTWMGKAKDGVAANASPWRGTATGQGEAKLFRIFDRQGRLCHIEGAIPDELQIKDRNITPGVTVTVPTFVIKSGNR